MHILLTEDEMIARICVMTRGNTMERVLSAETTVGECDTLVETVWVN